MLRTHPSSGTGPSAFEVDTSFTSATGEEGVAAHQTRPAAQSSLRSAGVEWPEAATTTSQYEGRRHPKAKPTTNQLLPVFPECLEEATSLWGN